MARIAKAKDIAFVGTNAFTGIHIHSEPYITRTEIYSKISLLESYFQVAIKNSNTPTKQQNLDKIHSGFVSTRLQLAELIALEVGKPISQAISEVDQTSEMIRHFSNQVRNISKGRLIKTHAKKSGYRISPLGPIHIIGSSEFPLFDTWKMAIPNIALGNPILLRSSQNTPLLGLACQEIFRKANIETVEYCFSDPNDLQYILQDSRIHGVLFNGSSNSGKKIAEISGKNLKRAHIETRGNNPFVILEDSDLNMAVRLAIEGRLLINSGQFGLGPKRFIVHEKLYEKFCERLVEKLESVRIGDPLNEETDIGPMTSQSSLEKLVGQVLDSVDCGDKILYGGEIHHSVFYKPTLVEICDLKKSRLWNEDVSGPVFAVRKFKEKEEALRLANDSEYGNIGIVVGRDLKEAEEFADKLEVGSVLVNDVVRLGFGLGKGGVKNNGICSEKFEYPKEMFANVQTYWIK